MSANFSFAFLATLFITALFTTSTDAQSSSCSTALVGLSPCLNYISSNDTAPSGSCCTQLASVVKSQPECLCQVLNSNSSSSLGITINETRALELPSACKVQTPSVSNCKTNGAPSPTTPSSPSSQTGNTGSKEVPDTVVNAGTTSQTANFIFFLGVVAASIAMIS